MTHPSIITESKPSKIYGLKFETHPCIILEEEISLYLGSLDIDYNIFINSASFYNKIIVKGIIEFSRIFYLLK
jgi:hypothetical protein